MQDPTSAAESNHHHGPAAAATPPKPKRNNRTKPPAFKRNMPPPPVLPGQIAFRTVCHTSTVGGLIGSSGSHVSQLRRDTGCKIHCGDPVAGTEDRVILVIGAVSPQKGLTLIGGDGEIEVVVVSSAQEAVIRVLERVWELEGERGVNAITGEVSCKLLVHSSQIGAVVGKGGKTINTIRNNSGAKIKVWSSPPPTKCAAKDEQLLQITGGLLAVKKALISVSYCLQDCPPLSKVQVSLPAVPTVSSSDTLSPDPNADLYPHLNSWLLSMEGLSLYESYDASKRTTKSNEASRHEAKGTECQVVFRLLCSNNVAGSVIGKNGSIVRALESKTGAAIIVAPPLRESAERIVTISSRENLESCYSPAQDAVILVFARIVESHIEKGFLSTSNMESPVTVRLLVTSITVSYLSDSEGKVISELREETKVDIQLLRGESVPSGASDNDAVLQITGGYKCVQNALYKVTCSIRDSPNEVLPEARMKSNLKADKDPLKGNHFGHGKSAFPSGRFLPKNAGVRAARISRNRELHSNLSKNSELGRRNLLATLTNTTVEIMVSEHVFGSVYGEDGGNLDQIRQISGASVQVYDPSIGKSEGRVVISGTPDQTFAAQSLLQAFIQTGQRAP